MRNFKIAVTPEKVRKIEMLIRKRRPDEVDVEMKLANIIILRLTKSQEH